MFQTVQIPSFIPPMWIAAGTALCLSSIMWIHTSDVWARPRTKVSLDVQMFQAILSQKGFIVKLYRKVSYFWDLSEGFSQYCCYFCVFPGKIKKDNKCNLSVKCTIFNQIILSCNTFLSGSFGAPPAFQLQEYQMWWGESVFDTLGKSDCAHYAGWPQI